MAGATILSLFCFRHFFTCSSLKTVYMNTPGAYTTWLFLQHFLCSVFFMPVVLLFVFARFFFRSWFFSRNNHFRRVCRSVRRFFIFISGFGFGFPFAQNPPVALQDAEPGVQSRFKAGLYDQRGRRASRAPGSGPWGSGAGGDGSGIPFGFFGL